MKKELISIGEDYTHMLPIFRELILKSGTREKDSLVFLFEFSMKRPASYKVGKMASDAKG
jgi:hypothetical protein